ncbi:MAG: tRNA pseudouridine(55) synthase TruB [Gammaproteobacteria bacterium]|nr:tRNA pseudouridine(55) synthase TruB [Gammaproteobacteria bacterium]
MPDGILLLDKPRGLSSNVALQRVRTLLGRVKGGHVGSLDPLATGMLPICLGEATKVVAELAAARKCYRFRVALGAATASGDTEGEVTQRAAVPVLEAGAVRARLVAWVGRRTQVPPMYSALKRDGQPLYRLARAGQEVAREARPVEIYELQLLSLAAAELELRAVCSKGTYVRVLAQDLAVDLGTLGHVTLLHREWVEPFAGQPMHSLAELTTRLARGERAPLLPPDAPLGHLPPVTLAPDAVRALQQGRQIEGVARGALPRVRIYADDGRFLGLGLVDAHGRLQPRRLLNSAPRPGSGDAQGL